jgi:nucleotide-binding universal stress UspA family protein
MGPSSYLALETTSTMSAHRILVPFDFTRVSDIALQHAKVLGKALGSELVLAHIVPEKKEIPEARLRLQALVDSVSPEYARIQGVLRIGSIFEAIDDMAVELDAQLVVMGTHGVKGMQFITGGRALRIVTECTVPVVITQEKPCGPNGYDDIVVPLDLHQDTKQKLGVVAQMVKHFNGRAHIISPAESDEFLRNQLLRNIRYAESYFSERGISFTTHISEEHGTAFIKDVMRYASEIKADLISIMNLHEKSLMGILGPSYAQRIITNEAEIPVLVVNPIETHVIRGSVFAQ